MGNSVRLLRESSETPNISNRDDARMIRYAYGGGNGIVSNYGAELTATYDNGIFHINSGMIVIQGWEIAVKSPGWSLSVSEIQGTQYHLVYAEAVIAIESAEIKNEFLTGAIPEIDPGDDLTAAPNGTAKYPLYSFKVTNGAISEVTKLFDILTYIPNELEAIRERIERLGYREGSVAPIDHYTISTDENYLKRQGNYVIGKFRSRAANLFYFEETRTEVGTIPEEFRPEPNTQISVYLQFAESENTSPGFWNAVVDSEGIMWINEVGIKEVYIIFGYEAKPL